MTAGGDVRLDGGALRGGNARAVTAGETRASMGAALGRSMRSIPGRTNEMLQTDAAIHPGHALGRGGARAVTAGETCASI